jgi:hypothetical protein
MYIVKSKWNLYEIQQINERFLHNVVINIYRLQILLYIKWIDYLRFGVLSAMIM